MGRMGFAIACFVFLVGGCGGGTDTVRDWTASLPDPVDPLRLEDDASRRSDEPGNHEWWNFFAEDAQGGVSISAIFLNGNMFDVRYREALELYRSDPEIHPAPLPADYPLLQLNVISKVLLIDR